MIGFQFEQFIQFYSIYFQNKLKNERTKNYIALFSFLLLLLLIIYYYTLRVSVFFLTAFNIYVCEYSSCNKILSSSMCYELMMSLNSALSDCFLLMSTRKSADKAHKVSNFRRHLERLLDDYMGIFSF